MSLGLIFPGWPEVRSQKWFRQPNAEKAVQGKVERWLRVFHSPAEGLSVMVGWETGQGWHLSIAHQRRYPDWDEIRDARYDLLPDSCTMAMLLPPKAEYVNLHQNCFHLHEVDPVTNQVAAP